ncbi:CG4500, partial [Drosophila busckii]
SDKLKPATSYTSCSLHEGVLLRLDEHNTMEPKTLAEFFHEACERHAERPALVWETPGAGENGWTTLNYKQYAEHVERTALMLLQLGLEERSSLGILAFNCPEWCFAELGAVRAGAIIAGIYPSNSAEAVHHVLASSDATVCIVDDAKQMAKLRAIKSRLPRLKAVVQLHAPYESFVDQEPGYHSWQQLQSQLNDNEEQLQLQLQQRERNICANECVMLVFTSGTTGMPKGVMLSHDNMYFGTKSVSATMGNIVPGAERLVTYLPLSHVAAQVFDIFLCIENGSCCYFADKDALKGTLVRSFQKARPTRMFGVPRVFEKFQERLAAAEAKSKPLSRLLLRKARETVAQHNLSTYAGEQSSYYTSAKYWLASRLIRPIHTMLGLDQCQTFFSGGAPVTEELKHFFLSIDMPVSDIYGMSESGGAIAYNVHITNLFSSGPPLKGVEVKILQPDSEGQGEIVARSRGNFMGYLNEPEKTADNIDADGWLHTGDLGYLDPLGNLVVTGRLKELIITAGGENIPPVHIEELIRKELPCVANALLVGDRRKYLTILLTLKTKTDAETGLPLDELSVETIEWLQNLGLQQTNLSELLGIRADLQLPNDAADVAAALEINAEPKLIEALEAGIKRANLNAISNAQCVQKFAFLPHEFSQATGEFGPTLKVKRSVVHAKYAQVIERLYK